MFETLDFINDLQKEVDEIDREYGSELDLEEYEAKENAMRDYLNKLFPKRVKTTRKAPAIRGFQYVDDGADFGADGAAFSNEEEDADETVGESVGETVGEVVDINPQVNVTPRKILGKS